MAQTVLITLGDDDILDYELAREHWEPVEFLRTRGFTAGSSGNNPVFAKSPGSSPGFGNEDSTEDKLIVDSVSDNYNRCGRRMARKNRIYVNSSGVWRKAPTLTLTLYGSYDVIDPAYAEWIEFEANAAANLREINLADFRWIARRVSVSYEGGTATTTLTLDAETHGEPGVDDTPPPETSTGFDPGTWTPGDWTFPPYVGVVPTVPVGNGLIPGLKRLALIGSNGHIYRTTNFDAASPSYDDVDLSGTVGGTVLQWCYDAKSNNAGTHGWVVTPTAIYKVNNIWGTPTATLQHTFGFSSNYRNIDFDYIFEPGLFGLVASNNSGATYVTVTRDGGGSWSPDTRIGTGTNGSGVVPAATVDARIANTAYTCARATAGSAEESIYRTSNSGTSWTALTNLYDEDALAAAFHRPYGGATNRAFFGDVVAFGTPTVKLFRGTIDTGRVDISPVVSTKPFGPNQGRGRFTLSTPSGNGAKLLLMGRNTDGDTGVFLTENAEAGTVSWDTLVAPSSGNNYLGGALIDPTGDELIVFGTNSAIGYSADLSTISSKQGNLGAGINIIGITG